VAVVLLVGIVSAWRAAWSVPGPLSGATTPIVDRSGRDSIPSG
jgi:hypothetical protein